MSTHPAGDVANNVRFERTWDVSIVRPSNMRRLKVGSLMKRQARVRLEVRNTNRNPESVGVVENGDENARGIVVDEHDTVSFRVFEVTKTRASDPNYLLEDDSSSFARDDDDEEEEELGEYDEEENDDFSVSSGDSIGQRDSSPAKRRPGMREFVKNTRCVSTAFTHHIVCSNPNKIDGGSDAHHIVSTRWICMSSTRLVDVEFRRRIKNDFLLSLFNGSQEGRKEERYAFATTDEGNDFHRTFRNLKRALKKRLKNMSERFSVELENDEDERFSDGRQRWLFEIVSAYDIRFPKKTKKTRSSRLPNPYCTVRVGERIIHRTKALFNTSDPIWTSSDDSLFILLDGRRTDSASGIMSNRITIELYDDQSITPLRLGLVNRNAKPLPSLIGKDAPLGCTHLSFPVLIEHETGERKEFPLRRGEDVGDDETKETTKGATGVVVLRWRRATQRDVAFLQDPKRFFVNQMARLDLADPANYIDPPVERFAPLTKAVAKTKKFDKTRNETLYRVQLHDNDDDPSSQLNENNDSNDRSKWMSDWELRVESRKPSTSFLEIGSGDLGRVYLEVLSCDGLPKTSHAFATVVYEDSAVSTDVVRNCRRPFWPSWSRRAFVLRVAHVTSELFVAVHHDRSQSLSNHQLLGRITLNLSRFRSNTEYTLRYRLCRTARFHPRQHSGGTIDLRLVVRWRDERKVFWDALTPSHRFRINTDQARSHRVVRNTVEGGRSFHKYSIRSIESYADELLYYVNLLKFDAPRILSDVFFWRTTHDVSVTKKITLKLPLASLFAWVVAVLVINLPQLIPSICAASVGTMMLFCLNSKTEWSCPRSYPVMLWTLVTGKSQPVLIRPSRKSSRRDNDVENFVDPIEGPHDDRKDSDKHDHAHERVRMPNLEKFQYQTETQMRLADLRNEEWEYVHFSKGSGKKSISPLKRLLWPLQLTLGLLCARIRVVYRVLSWRRCLLSFWVTTASFVLSGLFLFVPWGLLLRRCAEFFVYVCMSPLARIADLVLSRDVDGRASAFLEEEHTRVRVVKEETARMQDFKRRLFGDRVVTLLSDDLPERFEDVPLSSISSARPLTKNNAERSSPVQRRLWGQRLITDHMIADSAHMKTERRRSREMTTKIDEKNENDDTGVVSDADETTRLL